MLQETGNNFYDYCFSISSKEKKAVPIIKLKKKNYSPHSRPTGGVSAAWSSRFERRGYQSKIVKGWHTGTLSTNVFMPVAQWMRRISAPFPPRIIHSRHGY
jgi:hypothetical protein